jgi:hypothetical protein
MKRRADVASGDARYIRFKFFENLNQRFIFGGSEHLNQRGLETKEYVRFTKSVFKRLVAGKE